MSMMEIRPMMDIRLVVTCPQCTVNTRCIRRAITNGVYRSLDRLDKSAGALRLGQRVRTHCHTHSRL